MEKLMNRWRTFCFLRMRKRNDCLDFCFHLMAKHHAAVEKLAKKAERMYDRRSLKIAFQNKKIIQTVNEREKVKWVFLTLTVRNVEGAELKETMDRMTKA